MTAVFRKMLQNGECLVTVQVNVFQEVPFIISRDFQGEQLSLLGFGTMRLPLLADYPRDSFYLAAKYPAQREDARHGKAFAKLPKI